MKQEEKLLLKQLKKNKQEEEKEKRRIERELQKEKLQNVRLFMFSFMLSPLLEFPVFRLVLSLGRIFMPCLSFCLYLICSDIS